MCETSLSKHTAPFIYQSDYYLTNRERPRHLRFGRTSASFALRNINSNFLLMDLSLFSNKIVHVSACLRQTRPRLPRFIKFIIGNGARNNNDKYLETSRLDLSSKFIRKFNSIVREGKKIYFEIKKGGGMEKGKGTTHVCIF